MYLALFLSLSLSLSISLSVSLSRTHTHTYTNSHQRDIYSAVAPACLLLGYQPAQTCSLALFTTMSMFSMFVWLWLFIKTESALDGLAALFWPLTLRRVGKCLQYILLLFSTVWQPPIAVTHGGGGGNPQASRGEQSYRVALCWFRVTHQGQPQEGGFCLRSQTTVRHSLNIKKSFSLIVFTTASANTIKWALFSNLIIESNLF